MNTTLWRDSEGGKNFVRLATRYSCGQCSKRFDKPWVVATGNPFPDNIEPNAKVAFHWFDSHGFPEDMFYELVMSAMFRPEAFNSMMHSDMLMGGAK